MAEQWAENPCVVGSIPIFDAVKMISSIGGLGVVLSSKCYGKSYAYAPDLDKTMTTPKTQRFTMAALTGFKAKMYIENAFVMAYRIRYKGKTIRSKRREDFGYTFVAGRSHPSVTNIFWGC